VLAAVLTALAVTWAILVGIAPVLAQDRAPWVAALVYHVGSLICHQRPERSFHIAGLQMPVCARCFGLYAAGAAGLLLAWGLREKWSSNTARVGLALSALPIALSVGLEWAGAIETTNLFRVASGLPLGLTAGLVFGGLLRPSD
jgi:uncharacterized membrane protein